MRIFKAVLITAIALVVLVLTVFLLMLITAWI